MQNKNQWLFQVIRTQESKILNHKMVHYMMNDMIIFIFKNYVSYILLLTITSVLVSSTAMSPIVISILVICGFPGFSALFTCTEKPCTGPWQSESRLYSQVPWYWQTSPSNVLKWKFPHVLQVLSTWLLRRTGGRGRSRTRH